MTLSHDVYYYYYYYFYYYYYYYYYQSGPTYLFNKFKVMFDGGVQLLYCCMWYLLKVNVALQASQCLHWSRHSTRCG